MTDYGRLLLLNGQIRKARMNLDRQNARLGIRAGWTAVPEGYTKRGYYEDRITDLLEKKERAAAVLEKLTGEQEALRASALPEIESLPDPEERTAMRMRYLEDNSIETIAIELTRSPRDIYYMLERAIIRIMKANEKCVKGGRS